MKILKWIKKILNISLMKGKFYCQLSEHNSALIFLVLCDFNYRYKNILYTVLIRTYCLFIMIHSNRFFCSNYSLFNGHFYFIFSFH